MSEFFNVTLNKDVVIDDSVTNRSTSWSGQHILDEIVAYRVTKFEELSDVDVVNKKDKQVVVYSGDTHKFTSIDLEAIGDAAGISLKQVSKMGIVGSAGTPYVIDIPISTLDFKVPKINVLKFQLGEQNIIKNENSFNMNEASNFIEDHSIIFDGTAHLKNDFTSPMTYEENIESCKCFNVDLDKTNFKSITNLSTSINGTDGTLNIKGIPLDRLLIGKNDINLSNASNIDGFTLTASGSNPRIVCSVDGGAIWKTFSTDHWENINLTVDDVKTKGIDLATFNSMANTYWNLLITTNKIRFAYLLQDNNSYDELKIQYDGQGSWLEAKPTEYDVIYASNSLLQVKLYFSGDIKINY